MRTTILTLICCVLGTQSIYAQTGVHATDSRITYVGRTWQEGTSVSFDWTATYVRLRFTGTQLRMVCSDTGKDWFNVYVDGEMSAEPDQVITVSGDTIVTLFSAKGKARTHTITLFKRTEGEQGRFTLKEILVQGDLLQADSLKSRQIEFVGDSYTCGYGAENSVRTDRFTPATETSAKSYASIVARYFDADYMLIAHSGMGIARNYNTKLPGWYMPDRYMQTFDEDSTAATRWQVTRSDFRPDITVIFLGANDFSVKMQPSFPAFREHYMQLLNEVKAYYGEEHPILCCTKKGQDYLFAYVQQVAGECGLQNVHYCGLFEGLFHNDNRNLGADSHPNYEAHRKVAHVLIPYIATMTGWELQNGKVE